MTLNMFFLIALAVIVCGLVLYLLIYLVKLALGIWIFKNSDKILTAITTAREPKLPAGHIALSEYQSVDMNTVYIFDMLAAKNAGKWSTVAYDRLSAAGMPDQIPGYLIAKNLQRQPEADKNGKFIFARVEEVQEFADGTLKEVNLWLAPKDFVTKQ